MRKFAPTRKPVALETLHDSEFAHKTAENIRKKPFPKTPL